MLVAGVNVSWSVPRYFYYILCYHIIRAYSLYNIAACGIYYYTCIILVCYTRIMFVFGVVIYQCLIILRLWLIIACIRRLKSKECINYTPPEAQAKIRRYLVSNFFIFYFLYLSRVLFLVIRFVGVRYCSVSRLYKHRLSLS